jgi:hypothetical protein
MHTSGKGKHTPEVMGDCRRFRPAQATTAADGMVPTAYSTPFRQTKISAAKFVKRLTGSLRKTALCLGSSSKATVSAQACCIQLIIFLKCCNLKFARVRSRDQKRIGSRPASIVQRSCRRDKSVLVSRAPQSFRAVGRGGQQPRFFRVFLPLDFAIFSTLRSGK